MSDIQNSSPAAARTKRTLPRADREPPSDVRNYILPYTLFLLANRGGKC